MVKRKSKSSDQHCKRTAPTCTRNQREPKLFLFSFLPTIQSVKNLNAQRLINTFNSNGFFTENFLQFGLLDKLRTNCLSNGLIDSDFNRSAGLGACNWGDSIWLPLGGRNCESIKEVCFGLLNSIKSIIKIIKRFLRFVSWSLSVRAFPIESLAKEIRQTAVYER